MKEGGRASQVSYFFKEIGPLKRNQEQFHPMPESVILLQDYSLPKKESTKLNHYENWRGLRVSGPGGRLG